MNVTAPPSALVVPARAGRRAAGGTFTPPVPTFPPVAFRAAGCRSSLRSRSRRPFQSSLLSRSRRRLPIVPPVAVTPPVADRPRSAVTPPVPDRPSGRGHAAGSNRRLRWRVTPVPAAAPWGRREKRAGQSARYTAQPSAARAVGAAGRNEVGPRRVNVIGTKPEDRSRSNTVMKQASFEAHGGARGQNAVRWAPRYGAAGAAAALGFLLFLWPVAPSGAITARPYRRRSGGHGQRGSLQLEQLTGRSASSPSWVDRSAVGGAGAGDVQDLAAVAGDETDAVVPTVRDDPLLVPRRRCSRGLLHQRPVAHRKRGDVRL